MKNSQTTEENSVLESVRVNVILAHCGTKKVSKVFCDGSLQRYCRHLTDIINFRKYAAIGESLLSSGRIYELNAKVESDD